MDYKQFWGDTPDSVVYDIGVLLCYPHEYMNIDRNSEAWQCLDSLFMQTLPYDPFELPEKDS